MVAAARGAASALVAEKGRSVAGPASLLTGRNLPGGQPAADLEPLVAELGDALHDDLVLPAGPRAALLLSEG